MKPFLLLLLRLIFIQQSGFDKICYEKMVAASKLLLM